jgi:deoxyadenosine/deoxycytidine kinase
METIQNNLNYIINEVSSNLNTKSKIFSIEGNIGAGKTTLIENLEKLLKDDPTVKFVREPVDIWDKIKDKNGETILSNFYSDPEKYGFAFQIMAYSTRISLLRKTMKENPKCKVFICERSLDADKHIFAKMLFDDNIMDDMCYQIYSNIYEEYKDEFKLDGIIYVDVDPIKCYERIHLRSREGESDISQEYLFKCKKYHEEWLHDHENVLRINSTNDVIYDLTDPYNEGTKWLIDAKRFIDKLCDNDFDLYKLSNQIWVDYVTKYM